MIEDASQEWTETQAKWLDSVLSTPLGKRFIAYLRYKHRSVALNLKLEPGIDYSQVNAFINRDRESANGLIDQIVSMSQVKERKERLPDTGWGTRTLIRDPEQEIPTTQPRKPKKP